MFGLSTEERLSRKMSGSKKGNPPPRRPRRDVYVDGGVEPPLEELLHDPLISILMERDGVTEAHLRSVIDDARRLLTLR